MLHRRAPAGGNSSLTRHIALLRGINVGGHNKIPMKALQALCQALGHTDVVTYIQSGNVVFDDPSSDGEALAVALQRGIVQTFGLDIAVQLRSAEAMAAVMAGNPFLAKGLEPSRLHVVFLAEVPTAAAVAALDPQRSPADAFAVVDRQVYLHLPNGAAETKLTIDYFERKLGTRATARNWLTVAKLGDMAGR